jgi:hypothetical protein
MMEYIQSFWLTSSVDIHLRVNRVLLDLVTRKFIFYEVHLFIQLHCVILS